MAIQIFERQNPYPQIMSELFKVMSVKNNAREERAFAAKEAQANRDFQVGQAEIQRQFLADEAKYGREQALALADRNMAQLKDMLAAQTEQARISAEPALRQAEALLTQIENRGRTTTRLLDSLVPEGTMQPIMGPVAPREQYAEVPESIRKVYRDRGVEIPAVATLSELEAIMSTGRPSSWTHGVTDFVQPGITRRAAEDLAGLVRMMRSQQADEVSSRYGENRALGRDLLGAAIGSALR